MAWFYNSNPFGGFESYFATYGGFVFLGVLLVLVLVVMAYGKEGQEAINGETGSPATCPPSLTVPTFCVGLVNPDVGETVSIPVSV